MINPYLELGLAVVAVWIMGELVGHLIEKRRNKKDGK